MANYGSFMYRRNGRFYARLRVPKQFQAAYAKTHLRVSLDTSDIAVARLRVHEVVLRWKREFTRLNAMLDVQRLVAGSPLLLGEGLIAIDSASRETGIPAQDMLLEALRTGVALRLAARAWVGTEVPVGELEFDEDGSFITNSADGLIKTVVTGELFVRADDARLAAATGRFCACLFFKDSAGRQPVVFPLHAVDLSIGELLLPQAAVELIRSRLAAKVTPAMLKAAKLARGTSEPPPVAATAAPHRPAFPTSELVDKFLKAKSPSWSPATVIQMRGMCAMFVDVMDDPQVGDINRALIARFKSELTKLPQDIHLARRRLPAGATAADLRASVGEGRRMSERRADVYVAKIGEMFAWAVRQGLMDTNPAAGTAGRQRRDRREQDERDPFSDNDLQAIFSAPWFVTGRGERTAQGKHWGFQPHYFWLPLLGLHTGARLTELAQLYLSDIRLTTNGTLYIDFNLDQADKIEEPDKRLKTVNSIRTVPLHDLLLALGFQEYVTALKASGYERLFPELRFDQVKGYGKAAGQWFNERFLGNKLGMERNGKRTFHSFRHTFTTKLTHLADPPIGEFVINQLTGHERGSTMSTRRYAKDASPDALVSHIRRLQFALPRIHPFDVVDGLLAARAALDRKTRTESVDT